MPACEVSAATEVRITPLLFNHYPSARLVAEDSQVLGHKLKTSKRIEIKGLILMVHAISMVLDEISVYISLNFERTHPCDGMKRLVRALDYACRDITYDKKINKTVFEHLYKKTQDGRKEVDEKFRCIDRCLNHLILSVVPQVAYEITLHELIVLYEIIEAINSDYSSYTNINGIESIEINDIIKIKEMLQYRLTYAITRHYRKSIPNR